MQQQDGWMERCGSFIKLSLDVFLPYSDSQFYKEDTDSLDHA